MQTKLKFLLLVLTGIIMSSTAMAETAEQINQKADKVVEIFKQKPGASKFLSDVHGYLVFPSVIKGGFILGAEYGEGVLRVNNEPVEYYSIASGSAGFQAGAQKASYLIAFASQKALDNFRKSNGWEAGVDGTITVIDWGAAKDIASLSFEKPIYAFVFNAQGIMGGISIEGTKFTKMQPGKTEVYDDIQEYTK